MSKQEAQLMLTNPCET